MSTDVVAPGESHCISHCLSHLHPTMSPSRLCPAMFHPASPSAPSHLHPAMSPSWLHPTASCIALPSTLLSQPCPTVSISVTSRHLHLSHIPQSPSQLHPAVSISVTS